MSRSVKLALAVLLLLATPALAQKKETPRQYGIGHAATPEQIAGWDIDVRPDGRAVVFTGTSPHGQGHVTAWSMIASDQTGIPMDKIDVVWGDTDLVPEGGGTRCQTAAANAPTMMTMPTTQSRCRLDFGRAQSVLILVGYTTHGMSP